jgi:hypothetical protein
MLQASIAEAAARLIFVICPTFSNRTPAVGTLDTQCATSHCANSAMFRVPERLDVQCPGAKIPLILWLVIGRAIT